MLAATNSASRLTALRLSQAIASNRLNKAISLSLPTANFRWPTRAVGQSAGLLAAISQVAAGWAGLSTARCPAPCGLGLAGLRLASTHTRRLDLSLLQSTSATHSIAFASELVSLLGFRQAAGVSRESSVLSLPALRLAPNGWLRSCEALHSAKFAPVSQVGAPRTERAQCTADTDSVQQNVMIFCANWVQ